MRIKDDNEIKNILKIISPGTNLREGLENILRAKTGGLIVFGDSEEVMSIVDGGFTINAEYTPAYIYELAKMDGAIVLALKIFSNPSLKFVPGLIIFNIFFISLSSLILI